MSTKETQEQRSYLGTGLELLSSELIYCMIAVLCHRETVAYEIPISYVPILIVVKRQK